ncbi:MAG: flagellar biosynthetic protein FliO [Chlamydiales bacterium]|nr:flagellar biosynthetic protein FliO [Chlamydiales bacterium]
MKVLLRLLAIFVFLYMQPTFAQAPTQEEPNSEAYREWEQENVGREVAEEGRYGELWNKTLLLLISVLLVLFVGTWYLKKFSTFKVKEPSKESRIQLLEKRVISPKAVVYLLSIDGHKVAISETSAGVCLLTSDIAEKSPTET